jgi:hypothetical protein
MSVRFRVELPQILLDKGVSATGRPSVLAFGIPKGGSTLLFDVLRMMSVEVGLTFVSYPDQLFQKGLSPLLVEPAVAFDETGFCYGGFRTFPYYRVPLLETAKTVWLVRDPRDVMVSLYFSIGESHMVPQQGPLRDRWMEERRIIEQASIDEWVIDRRWSYATAIEGYLAQFFHRRRNVAIYRYEDVIFKKAEWLSDIAGWYEWEIPEDAISRIAGKVDVVPAQPDTTKHIRQVHPGDHQRVLSIETQKRLTQSYSPFVKLFGYPDSLP